DATTCLALSQLHEYLLLGGRHLVMCGMTQEVWDVMSHSGLIASIGKENLYMFDETHPHQHMHQAIARAKELLDLAPQPEPLPVPVSESVPVPE
ncbi:MAG: SulP family inorganic anion transporter, partial [Parachlamydiaceae bacterium]